MSPRRFIAVACVLLAGCATTGESRTAPSGTSSVVTASPDVSASGVVDTGSTPWSAKYGFGGVWVQLDPPADELIKVDAKTSKVVLRIDGGRNVAIASDGVWVAVGGHELRKIEPMSGRPC